MMRRLKSSHLLQDALVLVLGSGELSKLRDV